MANSPKGAPPREVVAKYLERIFPGVENETLRAALLNMKQAMDFLPDVSQTFNETLVAGMNAEDAAVRMLEALNVTAFLVETMSLALQRSREVLHMKLAEGNVCVMPRRNS